VISQPLVSPASKESMNGNIDQLSINTIRTLAMDAVQKANSGHPATPQISTMSIAC